jgi:hypothetical protein
MAVLAAGLIATFATKQATATVDSVYDVNIQVDKPQQGGLRQTKVPTLDTYSSTPLIDIGRTLDPVWTRTNANYRAKGIRRINGQTFAQVNRLAMSGMKLDMSRAVDDYRNGKYNITGLTLDVSRLARRRTFDGWKPKAAMANKMKAQLIMGAISAMTSNAPKGASVHVRITGMPKSVAKAFKSIRIPANPRKAYRNVQTKTGRFAHGREAKIAAGARRSLY